MVRRVVSWMGGCVLASAFGCVVEDDDDRGSDETLERALDEDQTRQRCDQIKAAAASVGITNPLLVAGIADHESGLAQCWSEATWTCQGPWSADCGGPTLAGAADGPCAHQQGGLGMFQLDAGTHAQTLSTYGDVTSVAGNVAAGVGVIIHKVRVCPNTPSFGSDAEVIDFINSAQPGTANYETFMTAMAWCYNGCAPSYSSCSHEGVKASYKAGVDHLRALLGDEYWNAPATASHPVSYGNRVEANADGRLEVFVRGDAGRIFHRWQTAPNKAFSSWGDLGGHMDGDPTVGVNEDGRLEVFVVADDGSVRYRWQKAEGGWASGWGDLGGVGIVGEPGVGENADGRLEVVVRSADGQLWHKWQTEPNRPFIPDWQHFGTGFASNPVVAANADGRLEVFACGVDDALWLRFQTEPSGGWSGWVDLGGILVDDPAVGRNADGRLEVFHVGTDGAVHHKWQMPDGGWSSGWASLGGVAMVGTPAIGSNADGRLEVFSRSADGQLWHKWQEEPNRPFVDEWVHIGEHLTADPQVARNADGRLELFVRGGDAALWHRWQMAPNDTWSGWASLGGSLASW